MHVQTIMEGALPLKFLSVRAMLPLLLPVAGMAAVAHNNNSCQARFFSQYFQPPHLRTIQTTVLLI